MSTDDRWRELNQQLQEAMAINDFQHMSQLYFEMALQTYHEGGGFHHLLEQRSRSELMRWKRSGFVTHVNVHTDEDCCPQCRKLNGAQFSIDDALQNTPLPQVDCSKEMKAGTPGWCRCFYLPVIEDAKPEPSQQEPKKRSTFTLSSAFVFIVILLVCSCALCYFVPQLSQ